MIIIPWENNYDNIFLLVENQTVEGCGENNPMWIWDPIDGYIQSPNYPYNYPDNANCSWIISIFGFLGYYTGNYIPGTRLRLRIEDLSLENG